jgi:hypothetical protein
VCLGNTGKGSGLVLELAGSFSAYSRFALAERRQLLVEKSAEAALITEKQIREHLRSSLLLCRERWLQLEPAKKD